MLRDYPRAPESPHVTLALVVAEAPGPARQKAERSGSK